VPYCNLIGHIHNHYMLKDRASNTLAMSASGGEEKYPYCFSESKSYFTDAADVCGRCRPLCLNEKCIYVLRYLKVFSSYSCFTKKNCPPLVIYWLPLYSKYLFAVSFLKMDESNLHSHMSIIADYLNIFFMFILRSRCRLLLREL